jgi:hypothetical protein
VKVEKWAKNGEKGQNSQPLSPYGAGGAAADATVDGTIAATKLACPFNGNTNSVTGKTALADCIPDATGTDGVAGTTCGAAAVKAIVVGGTCVCASTQYGSPVDANGLTDGVATKGCVAVAATGAIAETDVNIDTEIITVTNHGFYTGQQITYTNAETQQMVPLLSGTGYFVVEGADANTFKLATTKANALLASPVTIGLTNDGHNAQTFKPSMDACPGYTQTAYTAGAAGAGTLADCQVAAGFYISALSTALLSNDVGSFVASQIVANFYAPGAYDANSQGSDVTQNADGTSTSFACPFAGTTVQAGGKLADCTPSCGTGTNAVAVGGTCRCASTHYGAPKDASDAELAIVTTGCTACPTNSATAYTATDALVGDLTDCKVKPGYYIATKGTYGAGATGVSILASPANSYGAGGTQATHQTSAVVAATKTACVVKSTSAAGSDSIDDCKVAPGNYLSVASPSATGSGRIARSGSNVYAAGGTSISTTTAETPTACVYGGSSAIGSDAIADCTPSCGTVAVAGSGTCTCKAGRTGTPTPTTAAVTGGCTATLCAVNKYVNSNVCTACAGGTTIAKDGDASGADTTCAKTKCAVNQYVSSNVCTACAAGTTNALGDDASGADTACDATKCAVNEYVKSKVCTACTVGTTNTVGDDASGADTACDVDAAVKASSASRSDVSFATIAMVIATLLACAIV